MSGDSYETSSATSLSENTSLEEDNSLDENIVDPGPVEKKIEEYLKNFDLKNRIKNEILAEKDKEIEKEDEKDKVEEKDKFEEDKIGKEKLINKNATENKEKDKGISFQETIIFEETTNRILSPKETEYYQSFQNTCNQNPHIWDNPYIHGNQWFFATQDNVGLENRVGNKLLNYQYSEPMLNPQSFRSNSIKGEQVSFDQNGDLEKISLTTQIIDMQKEDKLYQLLEMLDNVKKENEDLKMKLKQQQDDLCILGPRYKYLEENFEEFIKMKEEYDLLRRQKRKSAFRCTETYDRYAQTWDTAIMCQSCVHTHEMLQNINEDNALCIPRSEISSLEEKFTVLKDVIVEREFAYENRKEKAELIHLTALNVGYRTQILELEAKHKQVMRIVTCLQNIIAKIYSPKKAGALTFQEREYVEGILGKITKSMSKIPKMEQDKKQTKLMHRKKT